MKLKIWIFCQKQIICSIWQLGQFWRDRNERKHILRRNRPRVPSFLSHRIVESLRFMIFDTWKVPSSPNGPWTSRWVLGFFLNTRGFWLNGLRRKSILENDTKNHIFSGKLENLQKSVFVENGFLFYAFFWGWAPWGPGPLGPNTVRSCAYLIHG